MSHGYGNGLPFDIGGHLCKEVAHRSPMLNRYGFKASSYPVRRAFGNVALNPLAGWRLPQLACPACHKTSLTLTGTIRDDSSMQEKWDTFVCLECGAGFDYRHRTGELRRS